MSDPVEKAIISWLLRDGTFYANLLVKFRRIQDNSQPTLCVCNRDGEIVLRWNSSFLKDKTTEEICALIEHEIWHIAQEHFKRFPAAGQNMKNVMAIKIGTDCAINQHITGLPKGGITLASMSEMLGKEVEALRESEYYVDLLQRSKTWKLKDQSGNTVICRFFENHSDADSQLTPEQVEEISDHIVKTYKSEVAKNRGTSPGNIERLVAQIFRRKNTNWKELLKARCFNSTANFRTRHSWKRLRRRWDGELKGKVREYIHTPVVAVDTSGSIYACPELLEEFTATIINIQESLGCEFTLIECDADIRNVSVVKSGMQLRSKTYRGGGGTDFRPVFKVCDEKYKPTVLIFLTDGDGSFPNTPPKYRTIWCSSDPNKSKYPFGDVIFLKKEEMLT